MLPSSQSTHSLYDFPASLSGQLYPSLSFSSSTPFAASGASLSTQNADPNAPEAFQQNIRLALSYVELIERAAKLALAGIEQAFTPASDLNPISAAAELASLSQYAASFADFLSSSGIGALPLVPPSSPASASLDSEQMANSSGLPHPPDEATLLARAERHVAALYARQQQLQENSAVVAGLLGAEGAGARRER